MGTTLAIHIYLSQFHNRGNKQNPNKVDFRSRRTLSAGTASAASLAALSPGSSARAVPAGVAAFRSNQRN